MCTHFWLFQVSRTTILVTHEQETNAMQPYLLTTYAWEHSLESTHSVTHEGEFAPFNSWLSELLQTSTETSPWVSEGHYRMASPQVSTEPQKLLTATCYLIQAPFFSRPGRWSDREHMIINTLILTAYRRERRPGGMSVLPSHTRNRLRNVPGARFSSF